MISNPPPTCGYYAWRIGGRASIFMTVAQNAGRFLFASPFPGTASLDGQAPDRVCIGTR